MRALVRLVYSFLDMNRKEADALLGPITKARSRRDAADAELRNGIIAAMERRTDLTATQIAEAAGMSRIRVYQILKEGRG